MKWLAMGCVLLMGIRVAPACPVQVQAQAVAVPQAVSVLSAPVAVLSVPAAVQTFAVAQPVVVQQHVAQAVAQGQVVQTQAVAAAPVVVQQAPVCVNGCSAAVVRQRVRPVRSRSLSISRTVVR